MSFKESPELQMRFVGRLHALHDGVQQAMGELRCTDPAEAHAYDLLLIGRDAIQRASSMLWGKCPEFEQRIEVTGPTDKVPIVLLP